MRLTIAKKISFSVILILVISVVVMAGLTSNNLQKGFNTYLQQKQEQELQIVSTAMANYYRENASFDGLKHNSVGVRRVIDRGLGREHGRGLESGAEREPYRQKNHPPPRDPANQATREIRDPDATGQGNVSPAVDGSPGVLPGPEHRLANKNSDRPFPPPHRPPLNRPAPAADAVAAVAAESPAQADAQNVRQPPLTLPSPQLPPSPVNDIFSVAPRVSLIAADGTPVFGALRMGANQMQSRVVVDGQQVGTVIAPIPQFVLDKTNASFVDAQLKNIFWIAVCLILVATLFSIWLGSHLVRPIAELRRVTREIASGKLQARADVGNQDELGDLAQHVNSMAQALELNEQHRGKMLADVSHELRTPLTVMRGEIEALLDGIRVLDRAAMVSLHAEVLQLNKLVDDLRQLTLADAGNLVFHFSPLNLTALIAGVSERFRLRMHKAQLQFELRIPAEAVMIDADASRITQVIVNLLENSLRYTDAGGQVSLELITNKGLALISIEDSAPGVALGSHEKLFDRLYRDDLARTRDGSGSGLGLSICRAMIQAHRGEIKAMPSPLGGVNIVIALATRN
ncbi:ATP-binding protein [Undibacterium sp. RuTC16W]|uniref:ATP-binding protein n=1 Tax=Undibacterium sp. RuTC16W TaxID=3413048 RepID=UPI003BEFB4CA